MTHACTYETSMGNAIVNCVRLKRLLSLRCQQPNIITIGTHINTAVTRIAYWMCFINTVSSTPRKLPILYACNNGRYELNSFNTRNFVVCSLVFDCDNILTVTIFKIFFHTIFEVFFTQFLRFFSPTIRDFCSGDESPTEIFVQIILIYKFFKV